MSGSTTDAGDGIHKNTGMWSFSDGVAPVFDQHVRKSVPGYDDGHDLICKISDHFVVSGSICFDVGCSTGHLLNRLRQHHARKKPKLIGIDNEAEMIAYAREKSPYDDIVFEQRDALEQSYANSDFIVMYYVLQFIKSHQRGKLLSKIWNEMNPGGAFLLFEKVRGSDSRFNEILTSCYWEFKSEKGFADAEILAKWRSLKGILEPLTEAGNIDLLKNAGWKNIETVWRWGPFEGFLAVK